MRRDDIHGEAGLVTHDSGVNKVGDWIRRKGKRCRKDGRWKKC